MFLLFKSMQMYNDILQKNEQNLQTSWPLFKAQMPVRSRSQIFFTLCFSNVHVTIALNLLFSVIVLII